MASVPPDQVLTCSSPSSRAAAGPGLPHLAASRLWVHTNTRGAGLPCVCCSTIQSTSGARLVTRSSVRVSGFPSAAHCARPGRRLDAAARVQQRPTPTGEGEQGRDRHETSEGGRAIAQLWQSDGSLRAVQEETISPSRSGRSQSAPSLGAPAAPLLDRDRASWHGAGVATPAAPARCAYGPGPGRGESARGRVGQPTGKPSPDTRSAVAS